MIKFAKEDKMSRNGAHKKIWQFATTNTYLNIWISSNMHHEHSHSIIWTQNETEHRLMLHKSVKRTAPSTKGQIQPCRHVVKGNQEGWGDGEERRVHMFSQGHHWQAIVVTYKGPSWDRHFLEQYFATDDRVIRGKIVVQAMFANRRRDDLQIVVVVITNNIRSSRYSRQTLVCQSGGQPSIVRCYPYYRLVFVLTPPPPTTTISPS
jgi:hypothetical protein